MALCLIICNLLFLFLWTSLNFLRYHLYFFGVNKKSKKYLLGSFIITPNSDFTFFNSHFNVILTAFLVLTLIFGIVSVFSIIIGLKFIKNFMYFLIPLSAIAILFFFSPLLMMFSAVLCSGFLINLTYSAFFSKWVSKHLCEENLLNFLESAGMLHFFFRLFSYVFSVSSSNQFFLILISTHLLSFLYVLFSRFYIFVFIVLSLGLPWITFVLLLFVIFLCLLGVLARFLINFSIVITYTCYKIRPTSWKSFLLTEPLFDPSKASNSISTGHFSTVTVHNHPGGIPPRLTAWKGFGYGIGLCTLGVSCFIGYWTWQYSLEARKQSLLNDEANRLKRWEMAKQDPRDASYIFKDHADELAEFNKRK